MLLQLCLSVGWHLPADFTRFSGTPHKDTHKRGLPKLLQKVGKKMKCVFEVRENIFREINVIVPFTLINF